MSIPNNLLCRGNMKLFNFGITTVIFNIIILFLKKYLVTLSFELKL